MDLINLAGMTHLQVIVKSPKIFAPQKVPKNFPFSFLSFDK